jgi:predicted membrane chloride channel (bestrophin family)
MSSLFEKIKECLETKCASRCMDNEEDVRQTALALEKWLAYEGRQGLIDTIRIIADANHSLQQQLAAAERLINNGTKRRSQSPGE